MIFKILDRCYGMLSHSFEMLSHVYRTNYRGSSDSFIRFEASCSSWFKKRRRSSRPAVSFTSQSPCERWGTSGRVSSPRDTWRQMRHRLLIRDTLKLQALIGGSKLEYSQKTHVGTRTACKLSPDKPGGEPAAFLP